MALAQMQNPRRYDNRMPLLKMLFWVYFLLLIFEGALRKWILPQFSAPLLLVRDPIALLIILEAAQSNKWPEKWSAVTGVLAFGLLGLCGVQMVAGDNPWIAAVYGLRSYLLPFPVAFIMGENLDAEDLRKFGVCTLWLLLPETALFVAQYLVPTGSFLNAGAYEGARQVNYVGVHARASGTFSYVAGAQSFAPLAAVFLLYGLVNEKIAKKWLLWAASFALVISVPAMGSRTFVFELAAIVACAGVAALCGVTQFFKSLKIIVPFLAVFALASLLPFFTESSKDLNQRFEEGTQAEGGAQHSVRQVVARRTTAPLVERFEEIDLLSNPIGIGMGQGAAAITKLLQGKAEFLAGEAETDRAILELGPFPGMAFMLFRFFLALAILKSAVSLAREGEPLALLLAPLMVGGLAFGILEQPTGQGFMVIFVAFSLAALKRAGVVARPAPVLSHLPRRPVRFSDHGL
jgi:hypothetical protein